MSQLALPAPAAAAGMHISAGRSPNTLTVDVTGTRLLDRISSPQATACLRSGVGVPVTVWLQPGSQTREGKFTIAATGIVEVRSLSSVPEMLKVSKAVKFNGHTNDASQHVTWGKDIHLSATADQGVEDDADKQLLFLPAVVDGTWSPGIHGPQVPGQQLDSQRAKAVHT